MSWGLGVHILQIRHIEDIEMKTASSPFITNAHLADETVAFYPDLDHLNAPTVDRAWNSIGVHYLPMCKNGAVMVQAQRRRVNWCQEEQQLQRDWNRVIFSDESWFEIGAGRRFCWRHHYDSGEKVSCEKRSHPPKVMIWGAVGHDYKSNLVFIDKNMTGHVYYEDVICSGFLDTADNAFGFNQWILQQDNARPHVRRDILEAMVYLNIQILPRWPPYSPDLNIIETVWAIMKLRARQENPKIIPELKAVVQSVWDNLSLQTINGLVAQMPRRLIAVIANQGPTLQHL